MSTSDLKAILKVSGLFANDDCYFFFQLGQPWSSCYTIKYHCVLSLLSALKKIMFIMNRYDIETPDAEDKQ